MVIIHNGDVPPPKIVVAVNSNKFAAYLVTSVKPI